MCSACPLPGSTVSLRGEAWAALVAEYLLTYLPGSTLLAPREDLLIARVEHLHCLQREAVRASVGMQLEGELAVPLEQLPLVDAVERPSMREPLEAKGRERAP